MTENTCACTQRHVPLPQRFLVITVNGDDVLLCPTTGFNVQALSEEYQVFGGPPPGSVTKHYSKYVRDLVFALYEERLYNG